jgi:hypothetical protein
MRTALLSLTIVLGACFNLGPSAPPTYAPPPVQGPSHPPTSAEQWVELEARATQAARAAGFRHLQPAAQLKATGFMVEHKATVAGGHCYLASLAWAFPLTASFSVGFQRGADGRSANDAFAVRSAKLAAPGGVFEYCADRDGDVSLTVTAITAQGTIANNELLEYALVIGKRREGADAATARRQAEAGKAQATRQWMDANVAAAKERERRDQESRCRQCREDFRLCQVQAADRRRHPRPGVTFSTSCESQFRECGFGTKSDAYRRRGEWPCGAAPQ